MTLQDIAQTLRTEAGQPGGRVTVDDALLLSGTEFAVQVSWQLWRSAGNVLLVARAEDIPAAPAGTSFQFPCTLPTTPADAFLGLAGNTCIATFEQQGSQFVFHLSITLRSGSTAAWTWETSFPQLTGSVAANVPLAQPRFDFVFALSPSRPPSGLQNGLNFSSETSLTQAFTPVAALLGSLGKTPVLGPLQGPIVMEDFSPRMALSATLGISSLPFSPLFVLSQSKLELKVSYQSVEVPTQESITHTQLLLSGTVTIPQSNGVHDVVDMSATMPLQGTTPTLDLSLSPSDALDTSLDKIGILVAGKSWDAFFAQPPASLLLPLLDTFGLQSYGISFGVTPFSLLSTTLSAGTLPGRTLTLYQNPTTRQPVAVLDVFGVTWTLFDPLGAAYQSLFIQGGVQLFGNPDVRFDASVRLPDLAISCALRSAPGFTVADWVSQAVSAFGGSPVDPDILSALSGVSLSGVSFDINLATWALDFSIAGQVRVGGNLVQFWVELEGTLSASSGYAYSISGRLDVGGAFLSGAFVRSGTDMTLSLRFDDELNPVSLTSILSSWGFDDLGVPEVLDVGLTSFGLVYNLTTCELGLAVEASTAGKAELLVGRPAGGSWVFFCGLAIDSVDLTNLPLVGQALAPLQTAEIDKLALLVSSRVLTAAEAGALNETIARLGEGFPSIPSQGMASTVCFSMEVALGGYRLPLSTGMGGTSSGSLPPDVTSIQGPPSGDTSAQVTTTSSDEAAGTTWFNVQKSFGPVTFRRIGVRYEAPVLWFELDASLDAAGLSLELQGLAVGSPLESLSPEFRLDGLGVAFNEPGLELGGALLRVPPAEGVTLEFAGGAVLRAAGFMLAAVGDYAVLGDTPSLFVFGQVTAPFGGPPALFVTGLSAGFGYNSALRTPDYNEVYRFPLVRALDDPSAVGGANPSPLTVLRILLGLDGGVPWITHEVGQLWLAAGLQFTTYEVVSTRVLAIAEFGRHFQFALVGLSTARFPMAGSLLFANLEMQVDVVVDPLVGQLQAGAALSPASFLLDPACKLSGDFATALWFAPSPHAGDFVIVLGGYHPQYSVPSHYPHASRVGLTWSLGSVISFTGNGYLAITPQAVMTGAALSATYRLGDITAWFSASANLLVYYQPFRFNADIGVTVGVSYRMDLGFTSHTFETELSATLELWGPPTGGSLYVAWSIISFTITFGSSSAARPANATWSEFQQLLPAPDQRLKILPAEGLLPGGATDQSTSTWRVSPAGFRFTTQSSIPHSRMNACGAAGTTPRSFTDSTIAIRPMQVQGLASEQSLTLQRNGVAQDLSGWTITPVRQSVASALWGTGAQTTLLSPAAQLLANKLVGFDVTAPAPTEGSSPGAIDVAGTLTYDVLAQGQTPLAPSSPREGPIPQASDSTLRLIQTQIASPSVAAARASLFSSLTALGVPLRANDDLTSFATAAGGLFATEPLLLPTEATS